MDESIYMVNLWDVKNAPDSPNNLISIGRLTDNRHSALFTATKVKFKARNGTIFGMGQKVRRMYQMRAQAKPNAHRHPQDFVAVAKGHTWDKWHRILGHISMGSIKMLKDNSLVQGLAVDGPHEHTQCKACIQGVLEPVKLLVFG